MADILIKADTINARGWETAGTQAILREDEDGEIQLLGNIMVKYNKQERKLLIASSHTENHIEVIL